jgi:hypothetical protein
MLSLVSTLAEDMNGVKMGLNHLAMTRVGGGMPPHFQQPLEQNNNVPFSSNEENKLIAVSDDEDDYEDEDEEGEEEDDDSENNESEYDDTEDEGNNDSDEDEDEEPVKNIKVLTLNINNDNNDINDINDIDESENLDLESMGDFEPKDELLEVSNEYAEEMLSLHYDEQEQEEKDEMLDLQHDEQEEPNITSSDFKTININLEESHSENIDFKKLSLPKLRSIVSEKNLVGDTSKLKKNELLKLLGIE